MSVEPPGSCLFNWTNLLQLDTWKLRRRPLSLLGSSSRVWLKAAKDTLISTSFFFCTQSPLFCLFKALTSIYSTSFVKTQADTTATSLWLKFILSPIPGTFPPHLVWETPTQESPGTGGGGCSAGTDPPRIRWSWTWERNMKWNRDQRWDEGQFGV